MPMFLICFTMGGFGYSSSFLRRVILYTASMLNNVVTCMTTCTSRLEGHTFYIYICCLYELFRKCFHKGSYPADIVSFWLRWRILLSESYNIHIPQHICSQLFSIWIIDLVYNWVLLYGIISFYAHIFVIFIINWTESCPWYMLS